MMFSMIFTVVLTVAVLGYIRWSDMKVTRLRLRHQERQLTTMRSFLMKHIDVMQKMERIAQNPEKRELLDERDWQELEAFLETSDDLFVSRLRRQFPELSEKDQRLLMLLRLKLPAKSLAMLYGISEKSVKQKLFLYKTKVGLDGETSLRTFIENF